MQPRKIVFANNELYHIYNRSIAKEQIFISHSQIYKIFETIDYYRYPQTLKFSEFRTLPVKQRNEYTYLLGKKNPLVEIYTFSFMPNHFHLLLKQMETNGIKTFISILQNSYAKYFNKRNDRQGGLFQSPFQGVRIEDDQQFIHTSRYIHLNHVTAYIIPAEQLSTYPYSSFYDYSGEARFPWINTKPLLSLFPTKEAYQKFVLDQSEYQKTLAHLKDITID